MKKTVLIISIIILVTALFSAWWLHPKSGAATYVTSSACMDCHQEEGHSWVRTLHPKMFRPVTSDADILGDFTSSDPLLTFSRDAVQYVVGNRWEQVYVTMTDGEYHPLPARWFIKQQKWVPYKVDSWQTFNMSKNCNGCHTTGFDPATFAFSEFGIGCESCHGPGSRHVAHNRKRTSWRCKICHLRPAGTVNKQKDIILSVSSTVCGQCHNRGKNKPFSSQDTPVFNFPVQYVPGEDLAKSFTPLTPEKDKENKYWWGNGIAKKRHQEFADWGKSNHAKALTNLRRNHTLMMGDLDESCLQCHSTDYLMADNDAKPTVRTAQYGITCVACHDPHKMGEDVKRLPNEPCKRCHFPEKGLCRSTAKYNHFPCPEDKVECVDCHMPYVVKSGGWFSIRGHAFVIVSPFDSALDKKSDKKSGKKSFMPNSCQNGGCHQDRTLEWMQREYSSYYSRADNDNQ